MPDYDDHEYHDDGCGLHSRLCWCRPRWPDWSDDWANRPGVCQCPSEIARENDDD